MNPLPVTDADLNAYADGQVAPSRVAAIEDALARDPRARRRAWPTPSATTLTCAMRSIRGWPIRFRND